jgi:hypothetical protein
MKIVAFLVGVILLLPGACALSFLVMGISALPPLGSAQWRDSSVWGIIGIATVGWGFCFVISYGGIMLIRNVFKSGPPRPGDREPPSPPT